MVKVEVTVRHLELSDTLSKYSKDKGEALAAEFPEIEFVRIVLDQDGPSYIADIAVQGGRKMTANGGGKDKDMTAAINAAADRVRSQLRKSLEKMQEVR